MRCGRGEFTILLVVAASVQLLVVAWSDGGDIERQADQIRQSAACQPNIKFLRVSYTVLYGHLL
jgi:hypothetical protein